MAYKNLKENEGGERHDEPLDIEDVKYIELDGYTLISVVSFEGK